MVFWSASVPAMQALGPCDSVAERGTGLCKFAATMHRASVAVRTNGADWAQGRAAGYSAIPDVSSNRYPRPPVYSYGMHHPSCKSPRQGKYSLLTLAYLMH